MLVGCGKQNSEENKETNNNPNVETPSNEEETIELTDKEKLVGCWVEERNGSYIYRDLNMDITAFAGYDKVDGSSDKSHWESFYDLTGTRYIVAADGTVTKRVEALKLYDFDDKDSGMEGIDVIFPDEAKGRPWLLDFPFREEDGLFSIPTMLGVLVWEDNDNFSTYFEDTEGVDGYYHKNTRISCDAGIFSE